jgi:hypothetical protein
VARVRKSLEVLLHSERDDGEAREGQRRLPPSARVGGEAEERDRDEDEDDLRDVLEVAVDVPHRRAREPVRERVADEDARCRERQRDEPGQRTAHRQS